MDDPDIPEAVQDAYDVGVTLLAAAIGLLAAAIFVAVAGFLIRRLGKRSRLMRDLALRMRRPIRAVLMVVALIIAVRISVPAASELTEGEGEIWWRGPVLHLLTIILIAVGAWAVGALAFVLEDRMLRRYSPHNGFDDRHSRRVRTQVTVVRRLTVALLVICAIAGILMTFPAARVAGASVFASAGLISIVAGLAAQTSLANVFAGMQIAFTDAIRQDDVVVLEGEWGRIEEITMTYVVVHIWDDRRLILPSTYFTTTPFENWTRRRSELLGTVELDLDWEAPVAAMRGALKDLLAQTALWDHRVGVLQVTEAVQGYVQVRATVSAADAPTLYDLRCYVREGMVDWLQRSAPEALPRIRVGDALEREDVPLAIPPGESQAVDVAPVPLAHQGAMAAQRASSAADEGAVSGGGESDTVSGAAAAQKSTTPAPAEPAFQRKGPRRVPRRKSVLGRTTAPESDTAATLVLGADGTAIPPWDGVESSTSTEERPAAARDSGQSASSDATSVIPPTGATPSSVRTGPSSTGTAALSTAAILTGENSAAESALFSGSEAGLERSKAFEGPGEEVYAQREESAERYEDTGEDGEGTGRSDDVDESVERSEDESDEEWRKRAPRDGDVTGNRGDGDGDGEGGGEGEGG